MRDSFTPRRVAYAVVALVVVFAAGTIGFRNTLHEGWLQSFYRTVVTTSLAGLDTVPRTNGARVISIVLVLAGLTIFAYVATILVEGIAGGMFSGALAERRRRRKIERLSEHYIICGYGRVGRRVADEVPDSCLLLEHEPVYTAGKRTAVSDRPFGDPGAPVIDVDRGGKITWHGPGQLTGYPIIKLREPDLPIVARASDEDAARKLRLAGADRVVQPYSTAGKEMANLVLRPQVAAFLDIVTSGGGPELLFEEIRVTKECGPAGQSIRAVRVRDETGAMIVALRKGDGTFDATPTADAVLEAGDVVIAAGTPEELRLLEELFAPREALA